MHQIFDSVLETNLLDANQHHAEHNRAHFDEAGLLCLNVMSSPGAGKTSLLEKTLAQFAPRWRQAVIEGDMTTRLDAERLEATGVPVIAITTGRACHLDAHMVSGGVLQLERLAPLTSFDLLWVENVGNLVCPAEFAIGEHAKVALLSVAEGEDKPLKYPLMFHEADCLLVSKIDLVPYVGVDLAQIEANFRQVNSRAPVFPVSVKTGEGLDRWYQWVEHTLRHHSSAQLQEIR